MHKVIKPLTHTNAH